MRYAPRAILAGVLGFAASFVVACGGGSGLLSGGQASGISDQLDSVSSALASRDCTGVTNATQNLSNEVSNLPTSVSLKLRANLTEGVSLTKALARRQCHTTAQRTTSTATDTTDTTTTQTHTTPTTPTNTNTNTTTTTTPTTTTPTTPATTSTPSGTTSTGGTGGAGIGQTSSGPSGGSGTGGDGNSQ